FVYQCSSLERLCATLPALRCGAARHSYSKGSGAGGLDRSPGRARVAEPHSSAWLDWQAQPCLLPRSPACPDLSGLALCAGICNAYCGCLLDKAQMNGFLDVLFTPDATTTSRLQEMANMCLMENAEQLD